MNHNSSLLSAGCHDNVLVLGVFGEVVLEVSAGELHLRPAAPSVGEGRLQGGRREDPGIHRGGRRGLASTGEGGEREGEDPGIHSTD